MNKQLTAIQDSTALRNYLESRTRAERSLLTETITDQCKIQRRTFYNWKYGLCKIPALYKDKIEEIIGEKVFVVLTD